MNQKLQAHMFITVASPTASWFLGEVSGRVCQHPEDPPDGGAEGAPTHHRRTTAARGQS